MFACLLQRKNHIVIIGCSFAALEAAKALLKAVVDITLIDRAGRVVVGSASSGSPAEP